MDCDDPGSAARSVAGHPYRRILLSALDGETAPVTVRDRSRAALASDRSGVPTAHVDGPPYGDSSDSGGPPDTDRCHPAVGDRWLTAPPIDRLARVIADTRTASVRVD